ncbi:MAG TPA: ergothioneine biosynthesis protein EgtB [Stellaceae bacterium]|nr:ergothioneine biosynthesis protein EgtB [Stellaceae bacterium]
MSPSIRTDVRLDNRQGFLDRYRAIRARTEALAEPLSPEDQTLQSMPDASPTKWHRAHTTWFFETFVLAPHLAGYRQASADYGYLFNSYYEAVGPRHPRPSRGMLSRPGMAEIAHYRAHVDEGMERLARDLGEAAWRTVAPLLELGLNHEEQHQELILMDIKHGLSLNPLQPAYGAPGAALRRNAPPLRFVDFPGGLREIGHAGTGFAFDNEGPRHKVWLEPFRLASRLVTCGEYLDFIAEGGYRRPEFWLSEGWATVQREGWTAPLYWRAEDDGAWSVFTLSGRRAVDAAEPVCHVSHFEADAYARWSGRRLPTEAEWEAAAEWVEPALEGNLMSSGLYHPRTADPDGVAQMIGDCWEWTQSPYVGYPGFRAEGGAVGEYNGKFMANQMVLRGGACVTPEGHVRLTYRNFFPSAARWAFGGIRLAEDL